jgi:lipid II:glycine glycyltransferase (peptidoglycan interpeptide bridge formation enzyme)
VTNWLPFYWAGFAATVRYTYRFDDLSDPDALWAGLVDKTRNAIRKAEKQTEVRDDLPFDEFLGLYAGTYARQGLPPANAAPVLRRLDAAASARGARRLLSAVDADGRTRAAIYIVFDERAAYYLLSGTHLDFPRSGETNLLLWEAIKAARETSAAFDFEGSMIESIERSFRSFGARQVPYLSVSKLRGPARVFETVRSLWSR